MTPRRNVLNRDVILLAALLVLVAAAVVAVPWAAAKQVHAEAPKTVRLYVFDCGWIKGLSPSRFGYQPGQLPTSSPDVATVDIPVPCYLIVHPKGTLMWDVGVIPDSEFGGDGVPVTRRAFYATETLKSQMAEIGYDPADITYLALSHNHGDHTANANAFASSTWLVRQSERDLMFGDPPLSNIKEYDALKNSKTTIISTDDYDVFGDGKVVIKFAPGHTVGHQVLMVKLKNTGPVIIAGDMFHFQQDLTSGIIPPGEYNKEQAAASRAKIQKYAKKIGAQIWIEHDSIGNAKLKKSPAYYD